MKKLTILVMLVILASAVNTYGQQAQGDLIFWIPFEATTDKKAAQIEKSKEYVSIKLHSVHPYYRSGFLENIKNLVISSRIESSQTGKAPVQGTMINGTWKKSRDVGDNVGLNDLLTVKYPALMDSLTIKISFRGIGEDRFKKIFDVLSRGEVKTAMGLNPATAATVGTITSIAQGLLSTPYASDNPKQILDVSQGFVVYTSDEKGDGVAAKVDALRRGYIVVISSREKHGKGLDWINQRLSAEGVRPSDFLRVTEQLLQYKDERNAWQSLDENTYVIFSVESTPAKGIDETSAWSRNFKDALKVIEQVGLGKTLTQAKEESGILFQKGSTLLEEDPNYLDSERTSIRSYFKRQIDTNLAAAGRAHPNADNVALNIDAPGLPADYVQIADKYGAALASLPADVAVVVRGNNDDPVQGVSVSLVDPSSGVSRYTASSNSMGNVLFGNVAPGKYAVKINASASPRSISDRLDRLGATVSTLSRTGESKGEDGVFLMPSSNRTTNVSAPVMTLKPGELKQVEIKVP